MKFNNPKYIKLMILIGVVGYSAICFHSIEEIHYLKSFFPNKFTVEEAFYASAIELIKVIIIGMPFVLVLTLFLRGLKDSDLEKKS